MSFPFSVFFQLCRRYPMEEFDYADFVSEERVVPEEKMGKYNLPFILFPFVFLFIFVINFGTAPFLLGIDEFFTLPNLFMIFTGGFLVHEMLHFLCWQALTQFPIEEFRIGMRWNSFTPVLGCQRPMRTTPFMIGLIFPFFVMGVVPLALSFYLANTWLLFSGIIFMAWASADILTFLLVWNSDKKSFVEMHRKKLGCVVYNPKETILEHKMETPG
jgi:hypothetical protein